MEVNMKTQFLKIGEGSLAYDDTGSGPLVLCVPGMGDLRGEYRFLVPQLVAAGYRAVTMDVRGHGESSVGWKDYSVAGIGGDILALTHHLNAGPAILVGNSMAAGAAVWAAVEAPELVSGLVLIGPAVHGEMGLAFRLLLGALFARPWGPAAWLRYYQGLFTTRKPEDFAAHAAALKENLSQPGRMEALYAMMLASKSASEERLSRVHQPTLVVMGTRDPDFKDPQAEAGWVAEKLDASCRMVDGAGHYPQSEMPAVTGPWIVEYLRSLQPESSLVAPTQG
jgi:pimeloyl-ACP methyl ester carboxylesterase